MKRAARWVVTNAAFAWLLWMWLADGIQGAHHLAVFYIWFAFIVSFAAWSEGVRVEMQKKGAPVPLWLDWFVDAAMACALVWAGHWALGAMYLMHALNCQYLFQKA